MSRSQGYVELSMQAVNYCTSEQVVNMETSWVKVPDNMLSKIAQNYQRTEKSLLEDVATLKNWLKTQRHLPEILEDKKIQNFLILNKCSVEKAKQRIDMYYTLRSKIPEIFNHMNPKCEAIKEINQIVCWVPLPNPTKEMYRIWVFKAVDKSAADKLNPYHVMSQAQALQEIRLKEDIMFGEVIITDLEGATFGLMSKFTPPVLIKIFAVYEKILSFPMKQFIIVNSPSYIGTFLTILKSILKPKLFERIRVCEDTSILRECFPKECLPRDYGGDEKSVEELFEMAKVKMQEYQSRFDELDQMRVDESLRPEKLENDEDLGFFGNFKKLDVD